MHLVLRALAVACALTALSAGAAYGQALTLPVAQTPNGAKVVATPVFCVKADNSACPDASTPAFGASGVTPISQAFTAAGNSASWSPVAGRPINVTITGTATGLSVRLVRSFDNGSTWSPLTVNGQPWAVWTGNVSEQAWVETEAPATPIKYRAEVTAIASGTATVRLSQ